MLAAQATEESLLAKKAVKIVVLMELTMVVDEATVVEEPVNLIDIAILLEGEDMPQFYTNANLLTLLANPRSKPTTAGVQTRVKPNSMTSRQVKIWPRQSKRKL